MLSRLVITFLPRSKSLLISWLQSKSSAMLLESQKIKSVTVSTVSPSMCHEVMGPDTMILVFWMLSFKPAFSLFSFTYIKRLFSSSSLSAIRWCHLHVWGYWCFSQQSWLQYCLVSSMLSVLKSKSTIMLWNIDPISKQSEFWSCHDGAASVRIPFCYKPSIEAGSNTERETERTLFVSIRWQPTQHYYPW